MIGFPKKTSNLTFDARSNSILSRRNYVTAVDNVSFVVSEIMVVALTIATDRGDAWSAGHGKGFRIQRVGH